MVSVVIVCRRRRLTWLAAMLLVLLAVGLAANGQLQAVSSAERLVPIYEVDTPQQAVAISFDASWGAEYTPQLLDILDKYQIKTTFFLVNIWIEDYPELTREIAARGHEIGLHSVSHPDFTTLSQAQMEQELQANHDLIRQTAGCSPTLFRPPFGAYNNTVLSTAAALGLSCIQWSVDSLDWKDLSAEEIFSRVTRDIQAGDIVLFHNNGLHTAEALPLVLDYLRQRELAVLPVSQLLLTGDWYVDVNGVQRSGQAKDYK